MVAVIIRFIVRQGRQRHADRARCEIVNHPPHHGADIKAETGPVEMEDLLVLSIVQLHVETAGHGNKNLVEFLVRMARPADTLRDVVQVINTQNIERDMRGILDKSEFPARARNHGKLNDTAAG